MEHYHAAAILAWQIELGADESIGDAPVDRYDVPAVAPKPKVVEAPAVVKPAAPDPVADAEMMARSAPDLRALKAAMESFPHCDLKLGARNMVFGEGATGAPVMIIGEAPNRDEDREGRAFVGRAGNLLDRMFAAIDMTRDSTTGNLYIANVLPWRPPQNRDPRADEIAMMVPFLMRHIELAAPKIVVLTGNIGCQALLGRKGISRLRGQWVDIAGRPALPMFHPDYLLRTPAAKREAWADLLALRARLMS